MELWQWALAALAALLVGISKTAVPGLGILAVAIFSLVFAPRESVGTVLLVLLAGDCFAVAAYRRQADWAQLLRLLPWAVVGIAAGALALGRLDERALRLLLGVILTALAVFQIIRRRRGTRADQSVPRSIGILAGVTAGFTTMVANAAGPIMTLYLLAMRLPKLTFLGTTAWYFFIVNLLKVPFGVASGAISATSLPISLALVPLAALGALLGRRLVTRIDQQTFEAIALWLTLVAGLRLLVV